VNSSEEAQQVCLDAQSNSKQQNIWWNMTGAEEVLEALKFWLNHKK
jgi:hypothetical protein